MSKTIKMGDAAGNATAHFTDAAGVEHPIHSVPVWAATPDGIVKVTAAADGMTAAYEAVGPGTATITATAECDPTAGVNTVTLSASLTVVDVEDTGGTIDLG